MICEHCKSECENVTRDDGFSYDYGSITNAYHSCEYESSDCCDAPALEGAITFSERREHVARKNHYDKNGKLIVAAGQRYARLYVRGYYIDEEGKHHGILQYSKWQLKKETMRHGTTYWRRATRDEIAASAQAQEQAHKETV